MNKDIEKVQQAKASFDRILDNQKYSKCGYLLKGYYQKYLDSCWEELQFFPILFE